MQTVQGGPSRHGDAWLSDAVLIAHMNVCNYHLYNKDTKMEHCMIQGVHLHTVQQRHVSPKVLFLPLPPKKLPPQKLHTHTPAKKYRNTQLLFFSPRVDRYTKYKKKRKWVCQRLVCLKREFAARSSSCEVSRCEV